MATLYLEPAFRRDVSSLTIRFTPRIALMQVSRTVFIRKLRGLAFGAGSSVQLALGPRGSIEAGIAFLSASLGAADIEGSLDPDRRSQGTMWDFRLGFVLDLK